MFTTPCFIRKDTPELRKKLEELGYFYTYYHDGNGIYCYNNIAQTFTYNNEIPKECIGIPKDNEELFLAIAALRDDTDKNQWLTDGKIWGKFGEDLSLYPIQIINYLQLKGHKATLEEIIEHFKNK